MKKTLFAIAFTLFCVVSVFTQSANDLLSQGIEAEQKGDNIQALTLYIQAHTADKTLAEADDRMNKMLGIVADGKFGIDTNSDNVGVKSQNLIRLRNEWNKLLLAATELIASNPPLFEAYYFNDVVPQPMKEEDYNNNTMSFTVSAPYLRPLYAPENDEIIHILSATLKNIEDHDVWGKKINGFPNTYYESTAGKNWLNVERETYSFNVFLFDNSKKQLASKTINYAVEYDKDYYKKELPKISIKSDLTGKFGKDYYIGYNADEYISEGEIEQIVFTVSMENVDSSSFSVTAEYAGKAELAIPISLAPGDVAQLYSANPENHKKIVGNLRARSDSFYGGYTWLRVVDQLESKFSSIDISEAYGLYMLDGFNGPFNERVKNIVIPEGCQSINKNSLGKFKELESLTIPTSVTKFDSSMFEWEYRGIAKDSGEKLKVVNYRGSERQWNTIEGHNNFGDVKINYLYEADEIKKEYLSGKEKILAEREKANAELLKVEEAMKAEEERLTAAKKAEEEKVAELKRKYESGVVVPAKDAAHFLNTVAANSPVECVLKMKIVGEVTNEILLEIRKAVQSNQENYHPRFGLILDFSEAERLKVIPAWYFYWPSWGDGLRIRGITLPASIREIEASAFEGWGYFREINYVGTVKQWKKIKIDKEGNEILLKVKINYEYKGK